MYKRILRKDGSVIVLVPQKETKAVTFEVLYKVGSRQEDKNNNCASHFVEHLLFKGTQKRPSTEDISKELDNVGAEFNAFTGKDHTGYYITIDSKRFPLAIDILSDMIHNSKFNKDDIDRERGVIIEEINMYEDNPLMYIEDVFESLLFSGTSLGKTIAGSRINVQTISRDKLYNYYRKYYYGGNAVIGVAGRFDEKKVLRLINKAFPIVRKKSRVRISRISKMKQAKPRIDIINKKSEQVQLMLGFESISSIDHRFLANQVLANIMGGTMSSRLFLEIREKRGLCYFIRTSAQGYEDTGHFSIHAGLNKEKIYEALEAIKMELNKVKDEGVSADELQKAKDNLRGRLILSLENANTHLNFLVSQELLNQRVKDLEDKLKELEKVSLSQVNKLAKENINWQRANLAIIGPFESKAKFLEILNS